MNLENKTLSSRTLYMIKVLKEKRLYHLVDAFIELSYHLKNQEFSYLKSDLYLIKSLKLQKKIIKYFEKYDIEYKPKPKKERKKEDKEKVSARQKKFVEKQKKIGNKKIQVYVNSFVYDRLLNMAQYKGVTQSEIINDCLFLGVQYWDK